MLQALRPALVLNCAAYNDVDGAESNAQAALAANGLAVGALAEAARAVDATLVHYSTDFVFDPVEDRGPLREDDPVRPRGVYAQSKLLGEIFAREAPRHYVLRVASLFGASNGKSSVDKLALAIRRGDRVRAFADRTVTPSYVYDVAEATVALLERDAPVGLYHCVNSGATTWVEVARTLARVARRRSRPGGRAGAVCQPGRAGAAAAIPDPVQRQAGRGRRRHAAMAGRAAARGGADAVGLKP